MNTSSNRSALSKALVIGTFAGTPMVMATMDKFLSWLVDPSSNATACYKTFNQRIAGWVGTTNAALQAKSLPIRVVHFASMWGIKYNQPGRYHWMLQIFLREEGFSLASIGTGRSNFNQAVTEKELQNLTAGLVRACEAMQAGGWWANDVR